jgi:hypothetical protein
MKKLIIAAVLVAPAFFVTSCAVESVAYDPGYSSDYVYSMSYYNNRPYWGNNYYHYGYGVGNYGYWGGIGLYNGL